ncbi:uncharacterized protein LOC128680638 isoform X2 [Plodia interpunctella]|uniref:uncharacterized protein LOC128680638 isoform X2 n=1 Tax=Plodia interpunctella TaxID=58824 RepID=UPI002368CE1A|nr:uncharacterized protein LOC128680638 isoform X2 [Plodia interpunctella]
MTSHKIEDLHTALLDKLLSESGLECQRSLVESEISEIVPEETEEQVAAEEKAEGLAEALGEEEAATTVEEIEEQKPLIFPTPSLRRVLPDRIRQIEESNRIHVLPKVFNTNIDPQAIPKIAYTAPQKYIDILAEIVGCRKYKSSLGEFWFLDTLANLLRRAQNEEFDRPTQAVLILWFCEWMKEMQHFDAADRQRMLRRFKDNMLSAARFIAVANHLPTPDEAGVYYMSEEERVKSAVSSVVNESKHFVTFEGAAYECSLRDLTKIIHYIFDLTEPLDGIIGNCHHVSPSTGVWPLGTGEKASHRLWGEAKITHLLAVKALPYSPRTTSTGGHGGVQIWREPHTIR